MNDFPQPKFEVSETDVDDHTRILDAAGEIHVSTAPQFSERLNAAIADGKTALVLDFSRVEFIDSTGLSVLLNGLRRLTRRKGAPSAVCTNPTATPLLETTPPASPSSRSPAGTRRSTSCRPARRPSRSSALRRRTERRGRAEAGEHRRQ